MNGSDPHRATMLARIRAGLGASGTDPTRVAAVQDRLARHPRGTIPARAKAPRATLLQVFADMLKSQGAEVMPARTPEDAVRIIAHDLAANGLPLALRMGADRRLAALPWSKEPKLAIHHGAAEPRDRAALSRAEAAAAETGTLFLLSGPDNPTTLAFLPEAHFILIEAADIAGCYEDAFDRLREIYREPRHGEVPGRPSRLAPLAPQDDGRASNHAKSQSEVPGGPSRRASLAPQDDGRASNHAKSQSEVTGGPSRRAWLAPQDDGRAWPRSVNMVSGPSRTADIEQTIVRGAHGPKRLTVLILA